MVTGYRDLALHYSRLFPLNDLQRSFFAYLLDTGRAESVLDVGCGTGEHLAWFAARGVRSYGLEPDETMFRELSRRNWGGASPTLARAGVEALPGVIRERVDLVLCLGNTLPHLRDREKVRQAVCRMADALAPQGRLVIQTVNFDRVLEEGRASFPVIERTLPDEGRVAFYREYDLGALPQHILFKTRLVTPAGEWQAAWPLVPLRRDELVRCMRDAGLAEIREFGDYSRIPYADNSPALIIQAQHDRWSRPLREADA